MVLFKFTIFCLFFHQSLVCVFTEGPVCCPKIEKEVSEIYDIYLREKVKFQETREYKDVTNSYNMLRSLPVSALPCLINLLKNDATLLEIVEAIACKRFDEERFGIEGLLNNKQKPRLNILGHIYHKDIVKWYCESSSTARQKFLIDYSYLKQKFDPTSNQPFCVLYDYKILRKYYEYGVFIVPVIVETIENGDYDCNLVLLARTILYRSVGRLPEDDPIPLMEGKYSVRIIHDRKEEIEICMKFLAWVRSHTGLWQIKP